MRGHRVYTVLRRQGLYGGFSLFYWAGMLYGAVISLVASRYGYLVVILILFTHLILSMLKKEDREIYQMVFRHIVFFSRLNTRLTSREGWYR